MTDHIDQLLHLIQQLRDGLHAAEAEAAEWKQACSGRTMSCSWCNDTAKKHDELVKAVQSFVELDRGAHGRQWLNAYDAMCKLANVKP